MLKTSLWPLQEALFERLTSNVSLSEKITGVFDDVPDEIENDIGEMVSVEYPYVTIGEPEASPFETKTSFGEEITIVLHCWSQYAGRKEAYDILNLMLQAITQSPLPIKGGFSIFKVKIEQMTVITDIDNFTKHGIMRLRFYVNN